MDCTLCGSDAHFICAGCAGTHYCGNVCQSADWADHEYICGRGGGRGGGWGGGKGKSQAKFHKVMREFKEGKLHSGSKSGPTVTSRKQALAIAYSEANQ